MKLLSSWPIYALGSAFFAGLTVLFGKIGVMNINSNLATFIRTIVIIVMITGILCLRNEWQKPQVIDTKTWVFLVLSGIATGLSWLCYYRAIQLGPISKVAPVDKLSVALAMIFGIFFLGEKLTWQALLGSGLVIVGAIIIVLI
jgi:transporter family protein